jgi:hypothetical protein
MKSSRFLAQQHWLLKVLTSDDREPIYRQGGLYWYRDSQWVRLTPEEGRKYVSDEIW